jgi:hypothetical protein
VGGEMCSSATKPSLGQAVAKGKEGAEHWSTSAQLRAAGRDLDAPGRGSPASLRRATVSAFTVPTPPLSRRVSWRPSSHTRGGSWR